MLRLGENEAPNLHYADHRPLTEHLTQLSQLQAQVRQVFVLARLERGKIALPDGALHTHWWKTLQYANAIGSGPLTRLLTVPALEMLRLADAAPQLLERYGVELADLQTAGTHEGDPQTRSGGEPAPGAPAPGEMRREAADALPLGDRPLAAQPRP